MDKIHSENPDNPFLLKLQLTELYSNPLIDQFFSVLLKSIGGRDFLILVIGESQSGKTSFLSKLIHEIEENIKPCQLKIRESEDPASSKNNFPAFLYRTENNQVIILDDAHDLHSQELSIILKNAWDSKKQTTQVILFSEPKLNATISSLLKKMPKKASVNKLYMPTFDQEQTESYIKHYLEATNFSEKFPFSKKNIQTIFKESKGLPGKINHEAHKIFSSKNSFVADTKQSTSKFKPTATFAIATIIFLIIGGFVILKKTSLIPMLSSNAIQSETSHNTITKKIHPHIVVDKIKKNDHADKAEPIQELTKKKQVVETKSTESTITETDITESETNNPKTAINIKTIPSQKQIAKNEPVITKPQEITSPSSLYQEKWIMEQEPNQYTIQIMAAKEKDAINRFLKLNLHTQNKVAYYKMHANGGVWYKFIFGNYKTLEHAKTACTNLPLKLKNLGPWPRQFISIQNDIDKLIKTTTD
ncbi:MAG: SPOR domain-containing protein [Desulfobacteraceae bacterium]|nr:SPOR domain-containing protein [Desulfobacteraceae bacterium]